MSKKDKVTILLSNILLSLASFMLGISCERSRTDRVTNVADESSEIVSYMEEISHE